MADASYNFYPKPPARVFDKFPWLAHVSRAKAWHNRVISAPTTAAEIRASFTNVIEGRTQVTITCAATGTDEQYMTITAGGTTYSLWIDVANDDTATATMSGTKLSIQHDDTPNAATVATRGAALLNAQAELVSWAVSNVIYVIGTDKTDRITAAANVDGPFTVSAITSGISLDIKSTDAADTMTAKVLVIDEDGNEVEEDVTLTGATAANIPGTPVDVIGVKLAAAATGTITVHERGGTSLTFATIAAADLCTINARYYVPDGRRSYMLVKGNIRDTSDNTALVEANGFNIECIATDLDSVPDDSVITDTATVHKNAVIEVDMTGGDEKYLSVNLGEVDLDGTAFTGGVIEQWVITWDE